MKKYYYSLFAAATMLLATTSCSQDEEIIRQSNEMTTFKVELEGATKSRTAGDGQTVDKLYYAVYDKNGDNVIYPNTDVKYGTATVTDGKASVELPLMKSEEYDIVFWAQKDGSGAYSFTNLKEITVNYPTDGTLLSNQENRDAFFNALDNYTADGNTQTVELRRPFAQLNVATTLADWEEATRLYQANGGTGDPVKFSEVTISQLATTFNALSGAASGKTEAAVLFNKAELLKENNVVESIFIEKKADDGTTSKEEYKLLAMNYLLMAGEKEPQGIEEHQPATGDVTKATVEVDFTLWKDDATEIVSAKVPSAPIQRNYRTNILGQFLTGDDTKFEIVVEEGFDNDHNEEVDIAFQDAQQVAHIYTAEGLKEFAALVNGTKSRGAEATGETFAGWTINLVNDIDLNNEEWTPIGFNGKQFSGTFDGNGKTISNFNINQSEVAGVGFIGNLSVGTVKNVKISNVSVVGKKNVGAIVGSAITSTITNCSADKAEVTATVVDGNDGDDAGIIVGYISGEPGSTVSENIVTNSTVTAYRDLGAVVGTANSSTIVKNNKASDTQVIADRTANYNEDKPINAGAIVGNIISSTVEENEETNVEVSVKVNTDAQLDEALKLTAKNIKIILSENVSLKGECYREYGGKTTETITIEGNEKTLTYKDDYRTYIKLANENATLILNKLNLYREANTGTHFYDNNMSIYCNTKMTDVNFNKGILLTNGKKVEMNNVTITKNKVSTYAMFIFAGSDVTIDGLTINHAEGVNGRGIKIVDEDMSGDIPSTKLSVSNATFTTEEKAAILVGSKGGAEIIWGEGNNISGVKADNVNAVWVDEAYDNTYDLVNVIGATKKQEGSNIETIAGVTKAGNSYSISTSADAETVLSAVLNDIKNNEPISARIILEVGTELKWETGGGHGSTPLLPEDSQTELTIQGNGTLIATGSGVGPIRLANNAKKLTVKDITIKDESESYAENSWEFTYLEIGENAEEQFYFENVTFADEITTTGNFEFKNCKFESNEESVYAVWVSGGSVKFDGCYFTGYRGLKAHEAYGSQISTIDILGCTFESITKKPGFAIGTFDANTSVSIKNSKFIGCQEGDQNMYIYETDTDVTTFKFVTENNIVADRILEIASANALKDFANAVNGGDSHSKIYVVLTADIDLNNEIWTPIGQTGATTFNGIFDGQNYTISNLNVNSEAQTGKHYSSGLFGWVESHSAGQGHIKNVKIDGATIKGHHNCGALVGYITEQTALVENCHVTNATISCTVANSEANGDKAGALIGNATVATPVKDCTATNSTVSAGRDAGQVIGAGKEANVTGCSATNVTVEANGTGTGANVRNEVIGRLL